MSDITRTGLYPGTFDPITNGHMDVIRRAAKMVDKLIIGVATNPSKSPLFDLNERMEIVDREMQELRKAGHNVEVRVFERKLLMHYAREVGASTVFRGLRAVTDFDYEFQMTGMNARIDPDIETVFLMASEGVHFISSTLVKEVAKFDGDISSFVSAGVAKDIDAKIAILNAEANK